MKRLILLTLLTVIIGTIGALDIESYQFIDHLLGLVQPAAPELFEDGVIFTAPSSYRSVGIAFAHENFSQIHYFQKLMAIRELSAEEEAENSKKKNVELYKDSGVLFFPYTAPRNLSTLEYRLIVNGLWTTDPLNPYRRQDERSGIAHSVVFLPEPPRNPVLAQVPSGTLRFYYEAPPGEIVSVAGDFNAWDPFMYEMNEAAPGRYYLSLPIPPGVYHYVFYHRGQRVVDTNVARRTVYNSKSGGAVSEVVVE
ncbi:MAG: glycogen-binding domain-containing protein [Treponema sp.]|jgi:hypothetical protein|nr:glycogen-binding domain-containing protein [Treponema sp.]